MFKKITVIGLGLIIILLLISCHDSRVVWNPELLESREDNSLFLSDEYFDGLDKLFKRVKYENQKWYVLDGSNSIAAQVVVTKMMEDLQRNPNAVTNHKNAIRYFEIFDNNIRKIDHITEEMHYFRNTLNSYGGAPTSLDEMITLAANDQWKLFSAKFHRYNYEGTDGALNVKFISKDGRFEAVYNAGTGEIVTDPANMGTYNYAPGSINPIKYYKHRLYDLTPWKKWGNVNGVSYKDIMSLESRHGSIEEKNNSKNIEKLIKQRKVELKSEAH